MASLVKIKNYIVPLTGKKSGITYNVIRNKVYTNKDYMPGPRPKTEEEMKKAAEKYGLHPAEYKLYPDDGMHPVGDYPMLPKIGAAVRDPYYPYDYPGERKNFGEVMHRDDNIMGEDRVDYGEKSHFGPWAPTIAFLAAGLLMFGSVYLTRDLILSRPVMIKQMPKPGAVHYTFDPAK